MTMLVLTSYFSGNPKNRRRRKRTAKRRALRMCKFTFSQEKNDSNPLMIWMEILTLRMTWEGGKVGNWGWNFKYFTAPSQHLQTMFGAGSNRQSSALPNIHIYIHLAAQCSKGGSRLNCWCWNFHWSWRGGGGDQEKRVNSGSIDVFTGGG